MTRLEYFKARLDATVTPADLFREIRESPMGVAVIDVRNGPAVLLRDRIPGALQVPESLVLQRYDQVPRDRALVVYGWDVWCALAARTAVALLELGLDVRELYGGINAWKAQGFAVEPVDFKALEGQPYPFPS
jgi:rhodanese-related sulfurtransferase